MTPAKIYRKNLAWPAVALIVFSSQTSGRELSLTLGPQPEGAASYSSGLGFGGRFGHTAVRGIAQGMKILARMNILLFGWPISFILLFCWIFRRRKLAWEYVFAAVIIGFFLFYFCYHGSHLQYYLETIPLLAILSALGAGGFLRDRSSHDGRLLHASEYRHGLYDKVSTEKKDRGVKRGLENADWGIPRFRHVLLVVGIVLSCVTVWPSRIDYFQGRVLERKLVFDAVSEANARNAIVLLDDLPDEMNSAIGRNSPDLDDDVVLAKKLPNDQWHRTVAMFPDRKIFILRMDMDENRLVCLPYPREKVQKAGTNGPANSP